MHYKTVPTPFADFAPSISPPTPLRAAITAAYRRSEADCVAPLIEAACVSEDEREAIARTAIALVTCLRGKGRAGGVEGLVKEYSLSSDEGVALMCLAEALLRIPDKATRNALIRDKIATGDWRSHLGNGRSIFVNAATWGLVISGQLVTPVSERGLGASLSSLIKRSGEPVVRRSVKMAMEMMGEQFVTGETIEKALKRARKKETEGFAYSYDMLGEAAMTMADAERYYRDYEAAIHAIGTALSGRGIYAGPGISIKLSALHPRYSRAQAARVVDELLPRVRALAGLAKQYDIGFNIDAEEADRLELSLDLLENLALDPLLAGWNGLGFVVQAYGKRCPFVIDWLADLAIRAGRRIMIRLVKGAYWDSEINRAQVDGLADFPVFTRKVHTDISYIACARKLLARRDVLFPQFATHNAQTLATIHQLAGEEFSLGDYEFQCLHGMGEALYEEVVGKTKLNRPCRIYAPVGTHETLLAYLVRRLLENGANSSFVNRIWDEAVAIEDLARDPVDEARAIYPPGAPHPLIKLPRDIYGSRCNSKGLDLSDETVLADLTFALRSSAERDWQARPAIHRLEIERVYRTVLNPADHREIVGKVAFAHERDAQFAATTANNAWVCWSHTSIEHRAICLERGADLLEERMLQLLGLIVREAGKSIPNAIAEVREAVDFLRYYAQQARATLHDDTQSLGPVVCISPWNFPLAIFVGQIAAALVTGNTVLAKPAEETPLIASEAVRLLHEAGVPKDALQTVPGDGRIGGALVAAPETAAVLFTGSTEVAKLIQAKLADRLSRRGTPIPLIAETGGQNAMIVDSSALAEQVVVDAITSAFDSAGQRCSALRILCLQEDIADHHLTMLKGALAELSLGKTDRLCVDIGPVISEQARANIEAHVAAMEARGCKVERVPLSDETKHGTFVPPTIIEIDSITQLGREVFGPVLHVIRYQRGGLDELISQINATGYGLTFGLHTRLNETIAHVTQRIGAGNVYVNRNTVGAVVGVQPFGGRGLSGTGPKAGGPLYLRRLVVDARDAVDRACPSAPNAELGTLAIWLDQQGEFERAEAARSIARTETGLGSIVELPGPVGELNLYALHPRGRVLLVVQSIAGLLDQLIALFATGNTGIIHGSDSLREGFSGLPQCLASRLEWSPDLHAVGSVAAALIEADGDDAVAIQREIAAMPGGIPLIQHRDSSGRYRLEWMLEEVSTSINTTAAGGNASLMALA